jgi:hypothetical protein
LLTRARPLYALWSQCHLVPEPIGAQVRTLTARVLIGYMVLCRVAATADALRDIGEAESARGGKIDSTELSEHVLRQRLPDGHAQGCRGKHA